MIFNTVFTGSGEVLMRSPTMKECDTRTHLSNFYIYNEEIITSESDDSRMIGIKTRFEAYSVTRLQERGKKGCISYLLRDPTIGLDLLEDVPEQDLWPYAVSNFTYSSSEITSSEILENGSWSIDGTNPKVVFWGIRLGIDNEGLSAIYFKTSEQPDNVRVYQKSQLEAGIRDFLSEIKDASVVLTNNDAKDKFNIITRFGVTKGVSVTDINYVLPLHVSIHDIVKIIIPSINYDYSDANEEILSKYLKSSVTFTANWHTDYIEKQTVDHSAILKITEIIGLEFLSKLYTMFNSSRTDLRTYFNKAEIRRFGQLKYGITNSRVPGTVMSRTAHESWKLTDTIKLVQPNSPIYVYDKFDFANAQVAKDPSNWEITEVEIYVRALSFEMAKCFMQKSGSLMIIDDALIATSQLGGLTPIYTFDKSAISQRGIIGFAKDSRVLYGYGYPAVEMLRHPAVRILLDRSQMGQISDHRFSYKYETVHTVTVTTKNASRYINYCNSKQKEILMSGVPVTLTLWRDASGMYTTEYCDKDHLVYTGDIFPNRQIVRYS